MLRKMGKGHEPFDMDIFMQVCGWAQWDFPQDSMRPEDTALWSNREGMSFGRVGDQFFYDHIDDWERIDAFFEKYEEASIIGVWHHAQPTLSPLMKAGKDVNPGPRKGYISVQARLTAPWPTSFDEAFDLMIRWECGEGEEQRAQVRQEYERVMKSRGYWRH